MAESNRVKPPISKELMELADTYWSETIDLAHDTFTAPLPGRSETHFDRALQDQCRSKQALLSLLSSMAKVRSNCINPVGHNTKEEKSEAARLLEEVRGELKDRGVQSEIEVVPGKAPKLKYQDECSKLSEKLKKIRYPAK